MSWYNLLVFSSTLQESSNLEFNDKYDKISHKHPTLKFNVKLTVNQDISVNITFPSLENLFLYFLPGLSLQPFLVYLT